MIHTENYSWAGSIKFESIRQSQNTHKTVFQQGNVYASVCPLQYMSEEGGKKAIASLHGYNSHHTSKPLVVELSHEVHTYIMT